MKKITIIVVSLLFTILLFSCKKDVAEKLNANFISVTLLDSSSTKVWVEVRPEKTQPYFSNGFGGAYSTNATKLSTFNYADTFGGLILYQSKSLQPFRFYVIKNGVVIDNQIRQNTGVFGYNAVNGDIFTFVIKD